MVFYLRIALVLSLVVLIAASSSSTVYVQWDSPGPTFDGSTWQTAYHTVQQGIDVALAGEQVWVAAGTYGECVYLKDGVKLCGGFAGTEAARAQRDIRRNVTVLDGRRQGSVVTVARHVSPWYASEIDGFTIRNGSAEWGGGIYIYGASPIIRSNIIKENCAYGFSFHSDWNYWLSYGGGIYCAYGRPAIYDNIIVRNKAVAGSDSGMISYASGGAIYCGPYSDASVVHSVISHNSAFLEIDTASSGHHEWAGEGGGIGCDEVSWPDIKANIIAGNDCGGEGGEGGGIFCYYGSEPLLAYNCFSDNADGDYVGVSESDTDIRADPLFANEAADDYRLTPRSPCLDAAGWDQDTDYDGFYRPQDGNGDGTVSADIGAHEYPADLGAMKMQTSDETWVTLGGFPVTAVFASGGYIYVQRSDRSAGIRVDTSEPFVGGDLVNVMGYMRTDVLTGERYIDAFSQWPQKCGGSLAVRPLRLATRDLGGSACGLQNGISGASGLNNIGLFVSTSGRIAERGDSWLRIDDGSAAGVKVVIPWGTTVDPSWVDILVTGISSCERVDGHLERLLRVRSAADITWIGESYLRAVSLTPNQGPVPIETPMLFTSTYYDAGGNANFSNCYLLFNPGSTQTDAAYFRYDAARNKLFVRNEGDDGWMGGYAPGTAGQTIANAYGRIYCEHTSVSRSGNTITVNWSIALKSPYALKPSVKGWMRVSDLAGTNTGWAQMGLFSVTGG